MKNLQVLVTDEFKASIGVASSPSALRRHLMQCDQVQALRKELADGLITEAAIERFTNDLMGDFVRGQQFPHELALATLAVVLESRRTKFAEDYLLDLARLGKISELDIAPRVAGICVKEWHRAAKVHKKTFSSSKRGALYSQRKTGEVSVRIRVIRVAAHSGRVTSQKLTKLAQPTG